MDNTHKKYWHTIELTISQKSLHRIQSVFDRFVEPMLISILSAISVMYFFYYLNNGLGLAYNDARSHLDIGRRVVEGLKPGLAQLGSVWLPLPHILMIPTIWNDFMWHSGLAGALPSMISFVVTALLIYKFLHELGVGIIGKIIGVAVFVFNLNILYLQSTAMTELLLIATLTWAGYELLLWYKSRQLLHLVKSAFWTMLASLIRYEGWFLFLATGLLVWLTTWRKRNFKTAEGVLILFATLAGFGIALWFLWNQLIFKDALYFAFGPFSARSQQTQLEQSGVLITKGSLALSVQIYLYALIYSSGAFTVILGIFGAFALWFDKRLKTTVRLATIVLVAPLLFNILALYLGHSVLFIQGLSGDTWFNVRYGVMLMPTLAIFTGYLIHRFQPLRATIIGLFIFVTFFAFANGDAVTIEDARVGSSQKNVSEVSEFLKNHAANQKGFILISAASHDAIIFSSGLPMKRFIHEGTGSYWEGATTMPDQWARWIVMRSYDDNDLTWKAVSRVPGFSDKYTLAAKYPFADVYELNPDYIGSLNTEPILGKQK